MMSITNGSPDSGRPLTAEDFARVEAIFAAAVALTGEARLRTLDAGCADRPDLGREVETLLAAHDQVAASAPADEDVVPPGLGAGLQIGAYRLLEKIGEGGMGDVYRAERADGAFVQQVAVKVMRSAIVHADLLRRFKVERQILASLHHASIVTLLDGGATPDGQAYLVMEYVEGTPITRHCRARALSLPDRLRLVQGVCDAVQYAHQHGIVHRDLKPANILIGRDGVPKVLDFGVAKLLEGPMDAGGATTGLLPGPLTPNYASPEQLRGLPVTTVSDVYALGVLLYELVTGVRPYDTQGQPLDRVLDLVVHTEPARPSAAQPDASAADLPYPRHRLRGDLDAIVLKAMSKDAAARYESAGALASDLTRFLEGEPVLARAPSAGYVLRRLAARNKTLVAVTTLALVGILGASGVALWQRQVAMREQARAEQRFRETRQLANALIFKIHDAVMPLAGSTPVRRTIVDEALAYLERLAAESAGDVTLRLELAAAYRQIGGILGDPGRPNLGDRDGAIRQYERARAMVAPMATETAHFDVISAMVDADRKLASLYDIKGDRGRAAAMVREAVDYATRNWQRNQRDDRALSLVASATFGFAGTLRGRESVPVWQRTLEYYERLLAEHPGKPDAQRNVALVGKYLGGTLETLGDHEGARPHYARSLELDEARLSAAPRDRRTQFDAAISFSNMASLAEKSGNLDTAGRLFERSLALRRQTAETDPTDVQARDRLGYLLGRMASFYRSRGDLTTARRLDGEAVRVLQTVFDTTHDRGSRNRLADSWVHIGRVEARARDRAAACHAYRRAHTLYRDEDGNPGIGVARMAQEAAREAAACDASRK